MNPNQRLVFGHTPQASNWRTAAAGWDTNQGPGFVAGSEYTTLPALIGTPPRSSVFMFVAYNVLI